MNEATKKLIENLISITSNYPEMQGTKVKERDVLGKSIIGLKDLSNFKGIAIFDLEKGKNGIGIRIWEGMFISEFIKQFPDYKDAIVHYYNDFYGEIVLRILKESNKENI